MEGLPAAMLLLGLVSGVHCVGMCGGFVAALSARRVIPITPVKSFQQLALFNAGRLSSYAVAGAVSGMLGGELAFALGAQTALYVLANVMLVAIGLHLAGATRWLSLVENLGAPLWRWLQPFAARSLGANAYVAGLFWGWVPCGLVYGALAAAAFAGSAPGGALAMAAYGLGTLPWLVSAGLAAQWLQKRAVRAAAGAAVLGFGVYGLARADAIRSFLCS